MKYLKGAYLRIFLKQADDNFQGHKIAALATVSGRKA